MDMNSLYRCYLLDTSDGEEIYDESSSCGYDFGIMI